MTRRVLTNMGDMISQSISVTSGLAQYGLALNLKYVSSAEITAARSAVVDANAALVTGRDVLRQRYAAKAVLCKEMRALAMLCRETLKPSLGSEYSTAWNSVGFLNSLRAPQKTEKLEGMAETMEGFFIDNPTLELPPRVTAVRFGELRAGMSSARTAAELQETAVKNLLKDRDEKLDALYRLLLLLVSELDITLDPMDARWLSFGFRIPGILRTPEVPTGVIAALTGTDAVTMKWSRATRARHYRVWKKVIGMDTEFVPVGNPADLDFLLEGLPGNSNVEIAVSAVNETGESARSKVVLVTTL